MKLMKKLNRKLKYHVNKTMWNTLAFYTMGIISDELWDKTNSYLYDEVLDHLEELKFRNISSMRNETNKSK